MSKLEHYRFLALITLDYLSEGYARSISYDGWAPLDDEFQKQKHLVEQYYERKESGKLKNKAEKLIAPFINNADVAFAAYILEKTNPSIDIFEGVKTHVFEILKLKKLLTRKDADAVSTVLRIYQQSNSGFEHEDVLKKMLLNYYESGKKGGVKTKSNPESKKQKNIKEIISPDGKKRLNITWNESGNDISTCVSIKFEKATGVVFSKACIDPDLNATWKNNDTIIITVTKKSCEESVRHLIVQSFDERVIVEYIEI
jgi:hypothetical protein